MPTVTHLFMSHVKFGLRLINQFAFDQLSKCVALGKLLLLAIASYMSNFISFHARPVHSFAEGYFAILVGMYETIVDTDGTFYSLPIWLQNCSWVVQKLVVVNL